MSVTFGVAEYKNLHAGLMITSVKYDEQSQSAEAMDEEGRIVRIDSYGKKKVIQIEATVKGDISALHVDGTVTVDGVAYGIDSLSTTKSNNGHHTASIGASAPYETLVGGTAS